MTLRSIRPKQGRAAGRRPRGVQILSPRHAKKTFVRNDGLDGVRLDGLILSDILNAFDSENHNFGLQVRVAWCFDSSLNRACS